MPLYLVHYDLQYRPDVEYPLLIPTLNRLGARRITATAWAVRSDMKLGDLRDEVQISAMPGDRFVIVEISDWRAMGTLSRIDEL
jgi:hypothetical protein